MSSLEKGAWAEASESLESLLQEYPNDRDQLAPLLSGAQLKASVKGRRIRGRSRLSTFLNRRRLTRLLVPVVLVAVIFAGFLFYSLWLAPLMAENALNAEIAARLSDAEVAFAAADYDRAETMFTAVLSLDPESVEGQIGLDETLHQKLLADDYVAATQRQSAGETEEALSMLINLQSREADYRDVNQRIDQIMTQTELAVLFEQAQSAYTEGRWDEAIGLYSNLRERSVSFQQGVVEAQLYESLMQAANRDAVASAQSNAQIEQTIANYRNALSLKPGDIVAQSRVEMLSAFLQGKGLIAQGRIAQSEQIFTNIYAADAGLLGTDLVQLLFNTRMALGNQYEIGGDLWPALRAFQSAATLPVPQANEALLRADMVRLALTPTVTPTATTVPTPTPDPLAILFAQLTPEPPAAPLSNFVGWIAFRSDRPGSQTGLWVMRPDGSGAQPVSDPGGLYLHMKEQATWLKDESARFWVESDGSAESVAIYMWRYDLPPFWLDARTEILNNSAINYQIQLSPDERYIVFTGQRGGAPGGNNPDNPTGEVNYGDEIFIVDLLEIVGDGYHVAHRLTWNDWQWDKHPTFSADSQTIFFWSNRDGGNSQIWAMNRDGSNQRNISQTEFNDWDPTLVQPYRELPVHDDLIAEWERKQREGE